jgi:hypothetical protein
VTKLLQAVSWSRAIGLHNVSEKITIDKSGVNTAAIESVKADPGVHTAYCASPNISITWSSKTTEPSSESPDPCLALSHSSVPKSLSPDRYRDHAHDQKNRGAAPTNKLCPQQINSIELAFLSNKLNVLLLDQPPLLQQTCKTAMHA